MPNNRTTSKKKTKKTKRGPKQATNRSKAVLPVSTKPSMPRKIVSKDPLMTKSAICAVTDPFCPHAKGARWPDGNGASTMTYQGRGLRTFTTFSNGGQIFYVTPQINYQFLTASSYLTGTYTMLSAYSQTGTSSLSSYASTARVVTSGIIIRNVLPALTAAGIMIVTRMGSMPAVSAAITAGDMVGNQITTYSIVAGMEIPIIFHPQGIDARDFKAANTSSTIVDGWDTIKVEIIGAPASTLTLSVEFITNVELTLAPSFNEISQFVSTTSVVSVPLQTVANKISKSVSEIAYDSLKQFGSSVATKAATAVGSYFGGPVGAGVANYGMNQLTNYATVD